MEVLPVNYMPGDPMLVDKIVCELKSQGIFDSFRKECIADVDTKPAYQNLRQRVEGSVSGFLKKQRWSPDMNKNHVREMLRKSIYESGFLETGVERIVDQVVNPKINTIFLTQVTDVVYKYLGIAKPAESNHTNLNVTIDNLLPKDLEAISPDSGTMERHLDDSQSQDEDTKMEEDESPPFEPIDENTVHEENSVDSHLSGFSGLLSHDSNQSDGQRPLQIDMDTQMSSSEGQSVSLPAEDQNLKMECEELKMDCDDSRSKGSEMESSDKSSSSTAKVDEKLKKEEKKDKDRKDRHRSSDRKDDKDKKSSDRKHSSSSSRDKKDNKGSSSSSRGDKHRSRHSSSSATRKDSSSHRDKSESKDRKSDSKSKSSSSSKRDEKSSSKSSSHSNSSKNKKSSSSSSSNHKDKKKSSSKDDHYSSKYRERRSTDRDSNDGSGLKSSSSSICESNSSSQNSTAQNSKPQDSNMTSNDSGNSDAVESQTHTLNLLNSGEVFLGNTNSQLKLYKPKIASNIHEARQLMKIRKQLKKLEQQSSLTLDALNKKNLVTNIIPKEDIEKNLVAPKEEQIEEPPPKPVLSVSMASWEALEAKLNQSVNFDEYNLVTTVEVPPPSVDDNGDVLHFEKSCVVDVEYRRKLLADAMTLLAREIVSIEARIALSICNNVLPTDKEINKENKRVGVKRKSSDKSDTLKKMKNNNNSIEQDENCSLPLSPTGSDKIEGRTRRANNVSKRYTSEDLYKPRPFITRTTTRCRAAQLE